jgi:hypothetical protein
MIVQYYKEGEAVTGLEHDVNALLMEEASDKADRLVHNDMKDNEIYVVNGIFADSSYTETAQELFNQYYDDELNNLYRIVNMIKELEYSHQLNK